MAKWKLIEISLRYVCNSSNGSSFDRIWHQYLSDRRKVKRQKIEEEKKPDRAKLFKKIFTIGENNVFYEAFEGSCWSIIEY